MMKKLLVWLAVIVLWQVPVVLAAEKPASEASVKELLAITQSKQSLEGLYGQIDATLRDTLRQASGGRTLSAEQQRSFDDLNARTMALIREELGWGKLEPAYVEVYRQTFTQKEIEGMIAFYKTPAGQAAIAKMPKALQLSMQVTHQRLQALMPKISAMQKETLDKLQAGTKK